MTYINKGPRAFRTRSNLDICDEHRSQSRIKRYYSSDARAWGDDVEQRRQHILEVKDCGKGLKGNIVPMDVILTLFTKSQTTNLNRLTCISTQLVNLVEKMKLTSKQRKDLNRLKNSIDQIIYGGGGGDPPCGKGGPFGDDTDSDVDDDFDDENDDTLKEKPSGYNSKGNNDKGKGKNGISSSQNEDDDKYKSKGPKRGKGSKPFVSSRANNGQIATKIKCPYKGKPQTTKESPTRTVTRYTLDKNDGKNKTSKPGPKNTPKGSKKNDKNSEKSSAKSKDRKGSRRQSITSSTSGKSRDFSNATLLCKSGEASWCSGRSKSSPTDSKKKKKDKRSASTPKDTCSKSCTYSPEAVKAEKVKNDKKDIKDPKKDKRSSSVASKDSKGTKGFNKSGKDKGSKNKDSKVKGPKEKPSKTERLEDKEPPKNKESNEDNNKISKTTAPENKTDSIKDTDTEDSSPKSISSKITEEKDQDNNEDNLRPIKKDNSKAKTGGQNIKSSPEEIDQLLQERDDLSKALADALREIEDLKSELQQQASKIGDGSTINSELSSMQIKMGEIGKLNQEKDLLSEKVKNLERELEQYKSLPNALSEYQKKCSILTDVLEERDRLQKTVDELTRNTQNVEKLKSDAARASILEQKVMETARNSRASLLELSSAKNRCEDLQIALKTVTAERDKLAAKCSELENEINDLRSKGKENELLRVEKDCLEIKMNEFGKMQDDYDSLLLKSKEYDTLKNERDLFRTKYEELVKVECQCDMLRAQVEAAKGMGEERDSLHTKLCQMQQILCNKDKELSGCKCEIDKLKQNNIEQKVSLQNEIANIKAVMEGKDVIIEETDKKISTIETEVQQTILGASDETINLRKRIESLEKELTQTKANLAQKCSQVKYLQTLTSEKDTCAANKNLSSFEKSDPCQTESFAEPTDPNLVAKMKKELEAAQAENKKLQDIANKMVSITGDEHVQQMLKQSECAVKRVVEELGRQYQQWDTVRDSSNSNRRSSSGSKHSERRNSCDTKLGDKTDTTGKCAALMSHLTKFKERVNTLEAENAKLKQNVDSKITKKTNNCYLKKEMDEIMAQKEKLEKQLRKEMCKRENLEKKLSSTKNSTLNCNC